MQRDVWLYRKPPVHIADIDASFALTQASAGEGGEGGEGGCVKLGGSGRAHDFDAALQVRCQVRAALIVHTDYG